MMNQQEAPPYLGSSFALDRVPLAGYIRKDPFNKFCKKKATVMARVLRRYRQDNQWLQVYNRTVPNPRQIIQWLR